MPPFDQIDLDYIERLDQQRRVQAATLRSANVVTAQRVSQLSKTYNGISPGLAYALGSAGYGVGKTAESLWQQELAIRREQAGEIRKIRRHIRENVEEYTKGDGGGILDTIGDIITAPVRYPYRGAKWLERQFYKSAGLPEEAAPQKDFSRYTFATLQSLAELVGAGLRYDPTTGGTGVEMFKRFAEQTTLGQHLIHGKSMGEGYFPGLHSPAGEAQAEAARRYSPYLIGGHGYTPGRAIADIFSEPDDVVFTAISGMIDASVSWFLDPTVLVLKPWSAYRAAKRFVVPDELVEAGLVRGRRFGFVPTKVSEHLRSPKTQKVLENLRNADIYDIMTRTDIPLFMGPENTPFAAKLTKASSNDEIVSMVEPLLGEHALRHGFQWKRGKVSRWSSDMPGTLLDASVGADWNILAREMNLHMINVGVPEDARRRVINKFGAAGGDIPQADAAIEFFFDAMEEQLKAVLLVGKEPDPRVLETIRRTRLAFGREVNADLDYLKSAVTQETLFDVDSVQIAGRRIGIGDPALEEQLFGRTIIMPDPRELRRAVSHIRTIVNSGVYTRGVELTDLFMSFWRRSVLTRVATAVRVIAEEQLRIATYGLSSVFSHPLAAISFIIGNPDNRWIEKFSALGTKVGERFPTFGGTISHYAEKAAAFKARHGLNPGAVLEGLYPWTANPLADALYPRFRAITSEKSIPLGGFTMVSIDDIDGPRGLVENLARAQSDPLVLSVAQRGTEATKKAFWDGDLDWLRVHLASDPTLSALKHNRIMADMWVDEAERMLYLATGSNIELIDAVRTGLLRGQRLMNPEGARSAAMRIVRKMRARGDPMPGRVPIARTRTLSASRRHATFDAIDNVFNFGIDMMLTRPSNYFSRHLMAQQEFMHAIRGMFPNVDAASRTRLISMFDEVNVPQAYRDELRFMDSKLRAIEKASPGGVLPPAIVEVTDDLTQRAGKGLPVIFNYPTFTVKSADDLLGTGSIGYRVHKHTRRPPYHYVFKGKGNPRILFLDDPLEIGVLRSLNKVMQNHIGDLDEAASAIIIRAFERNRSGKAILNAVKRATRNNPTKRQEILTDFRNVLGKKYDVTTHVSRDGDDVYSMLGVERRRWERAKSFSSHKEEVSRLLDLDTAGLLAARASIKAVKELLYDLSKKSQVMDMLRVLFPFGEAWKEVMTRWLKLTWENPHVIRRFQQIVQGARSTGAHNIYDITGEPDAPPGSGLFYKDSFGQEVVMYPGSTLFSRTLVGVPVPLKGRVQGLNLVMQGIPGIGPVVQIPLGYLLADKPKYDDIRNLLFPYGVPSLQRAVLPGWVNTALNIFKDPISDRVYVNAVGDVARYLVSTGKYDIHNPDPNVARGEMNRLLSDSKEYAKNQFVFRAFGQLVLPSAPSPEWLTVDKKGRLTLAWRVSQWYYDRVDKVGYEQAYIDFLNRFGVKNFLLTQGKSKAIIPRPPSKVNTYKWAREHPEIREAFPTTYGLFAPAEEGEESTEAYEAQFERGERELLTPQQMVEFANHRLATLIYNRFKAKMGDKISRAEQLVLRDLRTQLVQEFPGYRKEPVNFARREIIIEELQRASKSPLLQDNPVMPALQRYLEIRQRVIDFMESKGVTFQSRKTLSLRRWLYEWGERLVDVYPSFQPMWDFVFKNEVTVQEEPEDTRLEVGQ